MYLQQELIENLDTKKLRESFLSIPVRAKKESWGISYDKLADSLYYTPKVVPEKSALFNLSNEIAIYVNSKSEVDGLFIENCSANFFKHKTEFKNFLNSPNLKKLEDDIYTLKDKDKTVLFEKALEGNLIETINDKENLLQAAKFLVP